MTSKFNGSMIISKTWITKTLERKVDIKRRGGIRRGNTREKGEEQRGRRSQSTAGDHNVFYSVHLINNKFLYSNHFCLYDCYHDS